VVNNGKNDKNIKGRLSLGVADFKKLIEQNKIYVDKTKFIKQMLDEAYIYYFFSRPRRFGKTLFISTLENFFQGRKELFENTYIHDKWDWKEYSVIRISMKQVSNKNPQSLEKDLLALIENTANKNNVKLTENGTHTFKFGELIEKLSENNKNKGVVLIDEYDAPILSHLEIWKWLMGIVKCCRNFIIF
jgi:hypothetical protein